MYHTEGKTVVLSFSEVAVPLRLPSYLSPSDYSHAADIGNDHRIMAEEENSCGTEEETIESYGITQEDSQYQDKEDDMEAELDSMWQEMFHFLLDSVAQLTSFVS